MVRGDGNLITQEIPISDYDKIEASNSMKINYVQSTDAPGLTITTDQNIFEKYYFIVKDNTLEIKPKREFRHARFLPTEFTVTTNSSTLKKAELAGSIDLNTNSPIHTDKLTVKLAGSGNINLNEQVKTDKLNVEIAGSTTVNAFSLEGKEFDGEIAGSGKINLGGIMQKASFEIAGSGTVRAFDLQVEDLTCDIAGSGDIEVSVSNRIKAGIAGSGTIKYKGNPATIDKDVAGSGTIKKVD